MHHLFILFFRNLKSKVLKITIISGLYLLPLILATNIILGIYNSNKKDNLYEILYKVGYSKSKKDPYEKFVIQHLNPYNLFGLTLKSEERVKNSNEFVSLDNNGYRRTLPIYKQYENESIRKCILLVGGSTAFGHHVSSDDNTIASNLQKRLGSRYLVLNLGTPSWNSRQELISVINFLQKPISNKCDSIDSIAITGSNDIYGTEYLIKNDFRNYGIKENDLISAPEEFLRLNKMVEKIPSKFSVPQLTLHLFKSILKTAIGNIYDLYKDISTNKISKNDKNKKLIYTDSDKRFLTYQIDAFLKNHIFIANLIQNHNNSDSKNRHLVILQPNLLSLKIENNINWNFANQLIDKSLKKKSLPNNINIIDLRRFSLENKSQQKSLSDSLSLLKFSYLAEEEKNRLLNLNYFDDVHLTDVGSERVSDIIYKNYLSKDNN